MHIVEKKYALLDVEPNLCPPEGFVADFNGHGTSVASVAAGKHCGVAPNANLVFVQSVQAYYDSTDPKTRRLVPTKKIGQQRVALMQTWKWILNDVLFQRANGYQEKSIVCVSNGMKISDVSITRTMQLLT